MNRYEKVMVIIAIIELVIELLSLLFNK